MIGKFLLSWLEILGIYAVPVVIGLIIALKGEHRRQTRGLNLYEQFDACMFDLDRDIRMHRPYGTWVNRGGYGSPD